jgi:hypothetical protein
VLHVAPEKSAAQVERVRQFLIDKRECLNKFGRCRKPAAEKEGMFLQNPFS